jgi:hypothetical protein
VKSNALAPTAAPNADLHRVFDSLTITHLHVSVGGGYSKGNASDTRVKMIENRRLVRPGWEVAFFDCPL